MRVVAVPGAFTPKSDTWMLAGVLVRALEARPPSARVLDVGTGSSTLATVAALHGAHATAVDPSRRALVSAAATARANGHRLRTVRGDLLKPFAGERFDVIVSNPPYVPAAEEHLPERGPQRATDAGLRGRVVIDRLCAQAPDHLVAGGELLLIHSEVCDTKRTLAVLSAAGLRAEVVARERGPLGPLMRERKPMLEQRGLLAPGAETEEVVIVRGRAV